MNIIIYIYTSNFTHQYLHKDQHYNTCISIYIYIYVWTIYTYCIHNKHMIISENFTHVKNWKTNISFFGFSSNLTISSIFLVERKVPGFIDQPGVEHVAPKTFTLFYSFRAPWTPWTPWCVVWLGLIDKLTQIHQVWIQKNLKIKGVPTRWVPYHL